MARTGRPPQPTALKLAKGERRPSRVNTDEPQIPPAHSLDPPLGLAAAGAAEWKRVAQTLSNSGALRDTDLAALEDYCRALAELRTYERKAKKAGPELAIAKGYQGAVLKLRSQVNQLRRELGLTPSSRSQVKVKSAPGQSKDNAVQRYLSALPGGRA